MRRHDDEDITELTARHTYGTWRAQKRLEAACTSRKAEGCYFWDAAGKRYLDFSSQLICSNLGHQNQAVIDAICAQAKKLAFIAPAHTCDVRAELALKLLEVMPKGLDKFFFATSGTEANEAAIKIARMLHRQAQDHRALHLYHGSTAGSIAAHRRLPPLVRRADRQDPRRDLRARGQLLPLPARAHATPSATSPAPTTSPT